MICGGFWKPIAHMQFVMDELFSVSRTPIPVLPVFTNFLTNHKKLLFFKKHPEKLDELLAKIRNS